MTRDHYWGAVITRVTLRRADRCLVRPHIRLPNPRPPDVTTCHHPSLLLDGGNNPLDVTAKSFVGLLVANLVKDTNRYRRNRELKQHPPALRSHQHRALSSTVHMLLRSRYLRKASMSYPTRDQAGHPKAKRPLWVSELMTWNGKQRSYVTRSLTCSRGWKAPG
jgi:hypothetical protein